MTKLMCDDSPAWKELERLVKLLPQETAVMSKSEADMLLRRADYGGIALAHVMDDVRAFGSLVSAGQRVLEAVADETDESVMDALRGIQRAIEAWHSAAYSRGRYWQAGVWKDGKVDCIPPIVPSEMFEAEMAKSHRDTITVGYVPGREGAP